MLEIFHQSSIWLWILFLILIVLGYRQSFHRTVPPQPVIVISISMMIFSWYGVIHAFQGLIYSTISWGLFLFITLWLARRIGYPQGWEINIDTGRIQIPGSWLPLAGTISKKEIDLIFIFEL
jgi:hypothetical protein